jgi:hypothetical protein
MEIHPKSEFVKAFNPRITIVIMGNVLINRIAIIAMNPIMGKKSEKESLLELRGEDAAEFSTIAGENCTKRLVSCNGSCTNVATSCPSF